MGGGGSAWAPDQPSTYSSNAFGTSNPARAVDGGSSFFPFSGSSDHWLRLDLLRCSTLTQWKVHGWNGSPGPRAVSLETAAAGGGFAAVSGSAFEVARSDGWTSSSVFGAAQGRVWRVIIATNWGWED